MARKKLVRTVLMQTVGLLLALYFVAAVALFVFQRSVLYFPSSTYVPPAAAGADPALREVTARTEDGLTLRGWYAPATTRPYTIVYFHGNGDRLSTIAGVAKPYIDAGWGFFLVEYRGYNGMPGKPSEQGLYADARANLNALVAAGVKIENVVLFGYSLGTGVATQMATEFPVRGLILLAPYLSIAKVAQLQYPIFPAALMVLDRYENERKISGLKMPLLIGHGAVDRTIPLSQGQRLYDLSSAPKRLFIAPEGGHTDMFAQGFDPVSLEWLDRLAMVVQPLP